MFDSTKEDLRDILRDVDSGRLQLPDFQRSYVWDDEDLRSLVASVGAGYPVGALLTLATGGAVRFKPRLVEGVKTTNPQAEKVEPEALLLDGQQRVTSLWQALYGSGPVRTRNAKGREIARHYYLDIAKAVAAPEALEDAIIALPADRVERENFGRDVKRDLSSPEREYEADLFPLNHTFDWTKWNFAWVGFWQARDVNRWELSEAFFGGVLARIASYKMPVIRLDRGNSRAAICTVFEKVNVGGKKLDAFELVTAVYAADDFDLRHDWLGPADGSTAGRHARMVGRQNPRDVLRPVASVDFLKACALLHTRRERARRQAEGAQSPPQIACTREAILGLPLASYIADADRVEAGFVEAAKFLNARKIIWRGDVPYPNMTVALAAVFAELGAEAGYAPAQKKLDRWYWSAALGEQYGTSPDSRLARDMAELSDWIAADGLPPRALGEAVFQAERLRSLRNRVSAGYKALHALMMARGCRDFITGKPAELMTFFDDQIDIHHIFPKAWAEARGITPGVFNSIVNKTPLSAASNRMIGGDAPSNYLKRIEARQGLSPEALDDLLRSHLIEPELLRTDDFDGFFKARMDALADLVEAAMEKRVVRDVSEEGAELEDGELTA